MTTLSDAASKRDFTYRFVHYTAKSCWNQMMRPSKSSRMIHSESPEVLSVIYFGDPDMRLIHL